MSTESSYVLPVTVQAVISFQLINTGCVRFEAFWSSIQQCQKLIKLIKCHNTHASTSGRLVDKAAMVVEMVEFTVVVVYKKFIRETASSYRKF